MMGLIFQICDDYLNLSDTAYTKHKAFCEDFTEGKFSFPVVHSIRSNPWNLQLINILKQRTKDEDVKRYAISYMENTGSFEYTRNIIQEMQCAALKLIDEIGNGGSGKQPEGDDNGAMVRAILHEITAPTLEVTENQ